MKSESGVLLLWKFIGSLKATIYLLVLIFLLILLSNTKVDAQSVSGVISLTNSQRTSRGMSAYSTNSSLNVSAQNKANHMCINDYWAHVAPDGIAPWNFMSQAGYSYLGAGENLAKGYTSSSSVVNGWMNSPGHKANILHSKFKEIGVGVKVCTTNGLTSTIVVAHYGYRHTTSAPPAPAPTSATPPSTVPKPKALTPSVSTNTQRPKQQANTAPKPSTKPPYESKATPKSTGNKNAVVKKLSKHPDKISTNQSKELEYKIYRLLELAFEHLFYSSNTNDSSLEHLVAYQRQSISYFFQRLTAPY